MVQRRFPIGVEFNPRGAHFRVWAPRPKRVDVVLEKTRVVELEGDVRVPLDAGHRVDPDLSRHGFRLRTA